MKVIKLVNDLCVDIDNITDDKQAGNSIVVNVLEGILSALIPSLQPKRLESEKGGEV